MDKRCFVCFFLLLPFFWGCQGVQRPDENRSVAPELRIPTWSLLAQASTSLAEGHEILPTRVYVFPGLRLGANGQPIDQLAHKLNKDGTLSWHSPAPIGSELKIVVERKLRERGFQSISFGELTGAAKDHNVLVFNLYYTEARPSKDNPSADPELSWTTFFRISAATFPRDLNPAGRRDLIKQELLSLFNDRSKGPSAIKRSAIYLPHFIGQNRRWGERINMLD